MEKNTYLNHTVKQGETLWGIARHYKVEEHKIIQTNPEIKIIPQGNGRYEIAKLKEGQVLRIPQEKKESKRGVKAITGNTMPQAGVKEKYRVTEWYSGTPETQRDSTKVKWAVYYQKEGKYILKLQKEIGEFTFYEQAIGKDIRVVGYLYSPELDNDSALPIKVVSNPTPSITSLALYDINKTNPLPRNAKLKVGQSLYVVANTTNSVGKKIEFTLLKKEEKAAGSEYIPITQKTEKVCTKGTATTVFYFDDLRLLMSGEKRQKYRVNAQLEDSETTYIFENGVEIENPRPSQPTLRKETVLYKGTSAIQEGWNKLKESYKKLTTSEEPQIQRVSLYIPENKTKVSYGEYIKLKIEGKYLKGQNVEYSVYEDDFITNDELDSGIVHMKGEVQELAIQLTQEMYKKGGTSWFELSNGTHEIFVRVKLKGKTPIQSTGIIEVDTTTLEMETISGNRAVTTGKPDRKEEKVDCGQKYCIKKGDKNELIREINIRLAGFGGNVPTDEFTDRTEKMIKQFQRDYMKVPETGKICGNVLKAIDEFSFKYNISSTVWKQLTCSCSTKGQRTTSKLRGIEELNKCDGFGDGTGSNTEPEKYNKYEYPGIHRSLLFGLKALFFYLKQQNEYEFAHITSGYRCRFKNYKTTNHQGKAIDIQFNKGNWEIRGANKKNLTVLRDIRNKICERYLGTNREWTKKNYFSTEPIDLLYDSRGNTRYDHTFSWIHMDVREFDKKYLDKKYFCKNSSDLNSQNIVSLAKKLGFINTCNCVGVTKIQKKEEKEKVCYDCDLKFRKVAPIILEHEGGYVNDPDDSGGATNKGITIGTWRAYAKEDLGIEPTLENLKNITNEQATKIYRKRYWEPRGFCKINNDKVGLMIYDWTITSGGAGKEVQKLLVNEFEQSIAIDGDIGTNTINAINNVQDQNKLLNRIAEIRKQYYKSLAYDKKGKPTKNLKFLNGWLNRVDKCLNYNL